MCSYDEVIVGAPLYTSRLSGNEDVLPEHGRVVVFKNTGVSAVCIITIYTCAQHLGQTKLILCFTDSVGQNL